MSFLALVNGRIFEVTGNQLQIVNGAIFESAESTSTIYLVVTLTADVPTVQQIKDGQDYQGNPATWSGNQPVTAIGQYHFDATGLPAGTVLYYHIIQDGESGLSNDGVPLSGTFTTQQNKALVFGGDTYIDVSSGVLLDNAVANRVTYLIRADDLPLSRQDVWATFPDNNNHGGVKNDGVPRVVREDIGGNLTNIVIELAQLYMFEEDVAVPGTLDAFAQFGEQIQTDSKAVGATGSYTAFRIGGSFSTNRWRGIIRNLRVYDDLGTLVHHWEIGDGVADGGEITDLVGGAHGVLTLGSGYWIDWPLTVLDVANAEQAQDAELTGIDYIALVSPASAEQNQDAEVVPITEIGVVSPASAEQVQDAETVPVIQAHIISPADAEQFQDAEVASVVTAGVVAPVSAEQNQDAETVAITVAHLVAILDAEQAQEAEPVDLTVFTGLDIISAEQSQEAEVVAITQDHVVVIRDAEQDQIAEIVRLGGFVVGSIDGQVVAYSLLNGKVTATDVLTGEIVTIN